MATDRELIQETICRFGWGYDSANEELMDDVFTDDAVMTLEIAGADPIPAFEGKEALMGLFKGALAEQTDQRRHVATSFIFEEESPSAATVVSYLTLVATTEGTTSVISAGVYRDQLVKGDDGKWRIRHRHLALDSAY